MKKFLIIGDKNAITFNEIFPLIRKNRIWIGVKPMGGSLWFPTVDSHTSKSKKMFDGVLMTEVPCCWYTNIDNKKRHEKLDLYKKYYGHEEEYPKYDNYDAINVDKTADIPMDYDGVMGVPITYLDKHDDNVFEIVGMLKINSPDKYMFGIPYINGKQLYARVLIKRLNPPIPYFTDEELEEFSDSII